MSPEVLREHEQPEDQEQRELGDPRHAVVEGHDRPPGGRRGGAEHQPGEIDRQEARAVQGVGDAVGERGRGDRRHRVQAGGRQPHALQPQRRSASRPRGPSTRPMPSSSTTSRSASSGPEVGLLDRLDAADHEQDRDRVVEARLALERPRQAPPQRRAAQHGEHGRRVGRGHGRAEQQRRQRLEVEDQRRRHRGQRRREQRARASRGSPTSAARGGSPRSRWRARPRTGSAPRRRCPPSARARSRRSRSSPGRRSR